MGGLEIRQMMVAAAAEPWHKLNKDGKMPH